MSYFSQSSNKNVDERIGGYRRLPGLAAFLLERISDFLTWAKRRTLAFLLNRFRPAIATCLDALEISARSG
jgi:hypothetical protein